MGLRRKRFGQIEITETKSGKAWVKTLPFSDNLKQFDSFDAAEKETRSKLQKSFKRFI